MNGTPTAGHVIIDADELFRTYGNMIFRLAYVRTGSKADAEDVTQEVLVRSIINRQAGRTFRDPEHQKAWLIRVTLNCCVDTVTAAPRKHDCPELDDRSEIPVPEKEDLSDVTEAVMRMEPIYRDVVYLFYYEDMPVKRISQILRLTEFTVKTRLSRARKKLREDLKGEYGE